MATALKTGRPIGDNLLHTVIRVDYTELIAAATTQTIALVTLPSNAVIVADWLDIVAVFTDAGSISALAVEVGSTGDPNSLQTSTELLSGPPSTGRVRTDGVKETGDGLAVKALFTATGANLGDGAATDVDAGSLDVHILYRVV
jgi:hypothetical protein